MNILLIGYTGFIGKVLDEQLKKNCLNYNIFYFDSKNHRIEDKSSLFNYDLLNINHVFHLASKSSVIESWSTTHDFFQINVIGTINILEFCKRNKCNLTFLSSYLYGIPKSLPIYESAPLICMNPYAQTKYLSELNCDFYSKNYNIEIVIFRLFNAYGPGQSNNFLIPTIIEQTLSNKQEKLFINDLAPKRDFVYIDDIVRALIASINKKGDTYNISSGISYSVKEIIDIVFKLTGIKKEIIEQNKIRKNEINDLYGNYDKIKKDFNWEPEVSFESGLSKCIQFYQKEIS
jgi:nucleoside-diphosphate-sugar epimerase